MKIAHLAPTGNWAGTEEMVARMANGLASTCEVTVMMAEGEHITADQIRSRFEPAVRVILADPQSTAGERAAQVAEAAGTPDVIHAHLRPGLEVAWRLRDLAPVVGHLHVRYFSSQLWWVDAAIAVSAWQVRDIPPAFDGPAFLIPNSVAHFETASQAEVAALRRRIRAQDDSVLFGSVGRLSTEKGFDTLVRAFRGHSRSQDRLVIIGDGTTREHLESLAAEDPRVHLLGYVSEARRLLSGLDVYVSPSRLDSFGLSILEAMAVGLRVVSTNARGPADLLGDQPAFVVPIDDEDQLADAMRRAGIEVREGRAAPRYDLARYDHDVCSRSLADVYEYLVNGGSGPDCLVRNSSV